MTQIPNPNLVPIKFTARMVIDWRAICKAANIKPIVTPGEGPGSVTVKLLK